MPQLKPIILALSLWVALLPAPNRPQHGGDLQTTIVDPEAYRVYRAALGARIVNIAVLDETRSGGCSPSHAPDEWRAVWRNYDEENRRPRRLLGTDAGLPLILVTFKEFNAQRPRALASANPVRAMADVMKRFPAGRLITVSAVGFDVVKTRAALMMGYVCGYDCAGGTSVLMVREGGEWVPSKSASVCEWKS